METPGNLYADLSAYYDGFCSDVDYAAQGDFAARAFDCFGHSGGHDYMDLACGTGQLLGHMATKGFAVAGLDNSREMLDLAARHCPAAELVLCDLASFGFEQRFDLVSCFLYSIHYSHPVSAIRETLQCAFRALKPGGVLVFDMVDKQGITNRNDVITRLTQDGVHFTFQSGWRYAGCGEGMDLQVSICREDGTGQQRWKDHHTMTATTIAEVRNLMEMAGFEVTVLERDFSLLREWDGKGYNVVMVGRKAMPLG